jgi:hypothetical protein
MAPAESQHTRIEFTLDDYLHHLRVVLGCRINAAVREMARRIATDERVLLICREYDADDNLKGEADVDRRDFSVNFDLKFDMSGRLRVVPRTLRSMFGGIEVDSSADGVTHRIFLPKWHDDFVYTVVEQATSSTTTAVLPAPRKAITSSKKSKPTTSSKEPKKTQSTRLISLMVDTDLEKLGLLPYEVRNKVRPRFRKKYPNRRMPSDRTIDRAYEKYTSPE